MIVKDMGRHYEVYFPFDHVKKEAIKRIPRTFWNQDKKCWCVSKSRTSELRRLVARFSSNPNASHTNFSAAPVQVTLVEQKLEPIDKTLPKLKIHIPLKMKLREYQEDGVAYAIEKKSCFIADDQGLGKTCQAIAAVTAQNAFPCLVICQSSLILNWQAEWHQWTDKCAMPFVQSVAKTWPIYFRTGHFQVGVISFDSLKTYFAQEIKDPKLSGINLENVILREACKMFKSVIVDESANVKDPATIRSKMTMKMCQGRENVYNLSGTPVLNEIPEMYTQLICIGKNHLFGSYEAFNHAFATDRKPSRERVHWLNSMLHKHCFYRRMKSEVAKEIPEKTRQVILCDIDNRAEYNLAEADFKTWLESEEIQDSLYTKKVKVQAENKLWELKRLAAKGKLPAVYEWIETLHESGQKAVVFGHHKIITKAIKARFPGSVSILGDDPNEVRERNKQRFQTDPDVNLIVCSIRAAGVGHTLTAASNLGMIEFPWHYANAVQCEDRIHRIGQHEPCAVAYFLADKTVDRYCYDIIQSKKDIHEQVTGTEETVTEETVDKIINLFNQK